MINGFIIIENIIQSNNETNKQTNITTEVYKCIMICFGVKSAESAIMYIQRMRFWQRDFHSDRFDIEIQVFGFTDHKLFNSFNSSLNIVPHEKILCVDVTRRAENL